MKLLRSKILLFQGGLGNQIFEYAFYLHLKNKFPKYIIYGYYKSKWLRNQHNGLEINKVFDISLPNTNKWVFLIVKFATLLYKIKCSKYIYSTDNNLNYKSLVYAGFWQNKIFYEDSKNWIQFKKFNLLGANEYVRNQIIETNSVSIHIRRGDYLNEKISHIYGEICTEDYYKSAITITKSKMNNVKFFVFSDDIEWVKANLALQEAVYVTWNRKEDSFYDMLLMSYCKGNIIANSSFSYWGAYLNKNEQALVIYPQKWFKSSYPVPNIFPESWVGI